MGMEVNIAWYLYSSCDCISYRTVSGHHNRIPMKEERCILCILILDSLIVFQKCVYSSLTNGY